MKGREHRSNGQFSWRRVRAIARKEKAHILRDKFTLALALILPVVVVGIFGLAIEFNLNDIPAVVMDLDQTQTSRALQDSFGSSQFFKLNSVLSPIEGLDHLESERAKSFIIIPPGFEKNFSNGESTRVQVLIDAADGASAGSILSYLGPLQNLFLKRQKNIETQIVELRTKFLFNPELNSRWFTVPGLSVIIMTMLAILLTALTVAREWETGSMELLLSTPVSPLEIILGKLTPYAVLCLIATATVYFLARFGFGVPFRGSHFVYLLGCILFLLTYLAQGLMISVVTRRQMLAMQLAMMSGLLPSQLLSGFIFPIENMPTFFRYLTMVLPARWFVTISRSVFLQGSSLFSLRVAFVALTTICFLFIVVSVKKFKRTLEP